jgi:RNA polymerase sigma-70 factor (sigma-E family)
VASILAAWTREGSVGGVRERLNEGGEASVGWDADEAITSLYAAHYRSLVRLSALLVRDVGLAEEVVQDSFIALHGAWKRLRDPDRALAYLRQSVVNRSRSALRHHKVEQKYAPAPMPDAASAEYGAMGALEHQEVMAAVRRLPGRQREVLTLRYYAELSEAEIAEAIGISRGAVKSHASRAMATLRTTLERTS